MVLYTSNIWSAYSKDAIGTAIGDPQAFSKIVKVAIAEHDESKDRAVGQHFIVMPEGTVEECKVSCGVGHSTNNTDDYVLREYRGQVKPFLKRELALTPDFFAVVVYTRDAYIKDPDVVKSGEAPPKDATHVLVAAIANAECTPNPPPRYPDTLVACLAGGNNEAESWTMEEVKGMAADSDKYSRLFSVVAS